MQVEKAKMTNSSRHDRYTDAGRHAGAERAAIKTAQQLGTWNAQLRQTKKIESGGGVSGVLTVSGL